MSDAVPGDERANYLARLAFKTFRHWTATAEATREELSATAFARLPESTRRAWLEVALTLANEIWVDSRPPMEPTPIPRRNRSGKVSAFERLSEDPE